MGANTSSQSEKKSKHTVSTLQKGSQDIVRLMMPVYYSPEIVSDTELAAAQKCWEMILNNTAPKFVEKRKTDAEFRTKFTTCIMYFSECFYQRLFDVHPMARNLFRDMKSQGKFLVKMISLALSEKADPDKFEYTLMKLAEVHNDRGVKACEYGIVGDVLFWTIRACVGPQIFDTNAHYGWVKIYSRMLRTMVPSAIAHELKVGSKSQQDRLFSEDNQKSMLASMSQSRPAEPSSSSK